MALGWKTSASALLAARALHGIVAFNKRLLVIGGQTSGSVSSVLIESAIVDEGGNLDAFKVTAALPAALNAGRSRFGLAQNAQHGKDLLYLVGGANAANSSAFADVAIGQVNTDGSVLWRTGPLLPSGLSSVQAAIVNGWLYAVGGDNLAASGAQAHLVEQDITYTAVASGTGGNSITITYLNPGIPSQSLSVTVVSNAITVHLATDGGSALTSTATQIQAAVAASIPASALVTAVVTGTGSNVETAVAATHLAGGVTGTNLVSNVLAAKIQSDGTLGPWVAATPCPAGGTEGGKLTGHLAMGSKNFLYVAGGIPKGGSASQFIWVGRPEAGSGQNIAWSKQQLGMSSKRVNAAAPALLLGPLALIGGSTDGTAGNALATDDELKLAGDGSIISLLHESGLPAAVTEAATAALNRWVFLAGGLNASGTYLSAVLQANLQADVQV